jgi:membrane protein YqaA with SNARE-associated domain
MRRLMMGRRPVRSLRERPTDVPVAFGWGVAEAVLFFVIPDVFISYVAVRRGWRRGLALSLVATAGAVAGGLAAYAWGATSFDTAAAVFEWLPAIDGAMIERVRNEVADRGLVATFAGPLRGQPYKLYAAAAGDAGADAVHLALITVPARLGRFMVSAWAAGWLREHTARWLPERAALAVWAGFWLLVYVAFWS